MEPGYFLSSVYGDTLLLQPPNTKSLHNLKILIYNFTLSRVSLNFNRPGVAWNIML